MTTNIRFINSQLFTTIAIALIILLAGSVKIVEAQNISVRVQNIPPRVINGLFTPTQSQRFFQEGRRKFELEVKILDNPEDYFNGDILKIPPELLREQKQQNFHNFEEGN